MLILSRFALAMAILSLSPLLLVYIIHCQSSQEKVKTKFKKTKGDDDTQLKEDEKLALQVSFLLFFFNEILRFLDLFSKLD